MAPLVTVNSSARIEWSPIATTAAATKREQENLIVASSKPPGEEKLSEGILASVLHWKPTIAPRWANRDSDRMKRDPVLDGSAHDRI
jgi:hypothetical protein